MLTPTTGYAISALGCLARHGGQYVQTRHVAECADVPQQYLAKILHMLTKKDLVISQRGIHGGVKLARKPEEITLHEVCIAMEDPVTKMRCMLGNEECSDERNCPCHEFWTEHRRETLRFLEETTLKEIGEFSDHACKPKATQA